MDVSAPEGTLVNVRYPGPVSLNTTSCGVTTRYLANAALMQMLSTSENFNNEVMGLNAGHRNAKHAGHSQHGRYAVFNMAHGALDGSGARAFEDGINSGGSHMSCPNVEWFEMNFPILYLFRRHVSDAAGAGKFRGGAGVETAHMLHDCPDDKIKGVAYGAASATNSGQGVFGGYPGAPSIVKLLENTRAKELMSKSGTVENIAQVGGTETFLPYCEFELENDSVVYMRTASGGGYGDPLNRDPARVLADVKNGIVSIGAARVVYGVIIDMTRHQIDAAATAELRTALRQQRFQAV
jgi:N-methylhydantoinase B